MSVIRLVGLLLTQPTASVPTGRVVLEAAGGDPYLTPLYIDIPGITAGTVSMTSVAVSYYLDQAGIAPGTTYDATVTDGFNPANTLRVSFTILPLPVLGCTDPGADNYDPSATQDDGSCTYTPPQRYAHFRFSPAQSLRFVQPDNAGLPAFDNRFFGDERPLNLNNPGYCQKVERADTLVVQWQSNYDGAHTLRVLPCDGTTAALTVAPVRVVVGAGMSQAFDAYARPDAANAGRTRIYFNNDALPLPFLPGARVTLTNAGSLNGTYPVVDVREDPAAGVPYLALNVAYPSGSQRIDLSLTTPYNLQAFDTWQAVVPFSTIPEGCFQVHVGAVDSEFGSTEAVSEPIDVATVHRDTVLVVYRNFDNAFGLNYTAGLVNRLRVVGQFFGRDTATQKTTLRESTGALTILTGDAQRIIRLETKLLPDYVHEKLAVAFCHDFVRVNELKGIAEEKYEYPPTPAFTLTNGTVAVEQKDFLGAGNRDDVGDVDGGPYLIVNNQYHQINF